MQFSGIRVVGKGDENFMLSSLILLHVNPVVTLTFLWLLIYTIWKINWIFTSIKYLNKWMNSETNENDFSLQHVEHTRTQNVH